MQPASDRNGRARAWSFLVGGDLLYRVLAAGFWLVLARALDAPSLGDVALATALSVPALVVLDGGLGLYLVREADRDGRIPSSLRGPLRRRAVLLAAIPLLVAGATLLFGATADRAWIGLLVGASASFEGLAQVWLTGPRVRGHMRPDATFRGLYGGIALGAVAVAWAIGELSGLVGAAATAAGAAVAAAVCARHRPPAPRWSDVEVSDPPARRRFLQTTLLVSAFSSADVLMVGAILGSATLAPYALVTKIIATLRVLPIATMTVSMSWAARGEAPDAAQEVRTAARLGLALALGCLAAGPLLADVLFGANYARAMVDPLRVLAFTLFVIAVKSPLIGRHLGAGDTRLVARAAAVTLGVALVLLPPAILAAESVGAAAAALAAELAGGVVYVRHRVRDGWAMRDLLPGPLATVVAVAAGASALLLPPFSPLVVISAAIAVAAAAELGAVLRELRRLRDERSVSSW
jgi:O-antigen/teichoic acid export membrane protein